MPAEQPHDPLPNVSATPSRYIARARHQSPAGLAALYDLASVWIHVPDTRELGAVGVFISHLRLEKVPSSDDQGRHLSLEFAHASLRGLASMDQRLDEPDYTEQVDSIVAAWPGIFAWAHYLSKRYIERRETELTGHPRMDALIHFFNNFVHSRKMGPRLADTPGCLELVTKIWVVAAVSQDVHDLSDSLRFLATQTMGMLLAQSASLGKTDVHDRVVQAAGGDAELMFQLLLRRVKQTTKRPSTDNDLYKLKWYFNIVTDFCRAKAPNPLPRAFYDAGGMTTMTRAFVAIPGAIDKDLQSSTIGDLLTSCINFFHLYLEGDTYLSVLHAMKAGFLHAFLECSPRILKLKQQITARAVDIVHNLLPPYPVYRSVFEAVFPSLGELNESARLGHLKMHPVVAAAILPLLTFPDKRGCALQYEEQVESLRVCGNYQEVCELCNVNLF
ncbi:hypothetical protein FB45DRAFT_1029434 [Roridomyces roridus]|uniref:Uncharacterized protein n=1 Tax=Roridomyces roridus TaxID=1738132 RepID=A0AAD7BPL2_9AGAR|nr:hypothetical protein FB45DRAFT_1029434 [Roridomyces roridus]